MDLRSSYNFHFINAIKDGKAVKASNVWRGKPALKFKNVEDLYEFSGNGRHRSSGRHMMKVLLQELPEHEGDEGKVENSLVTGGSRIQIKRESGALEVNSSHGEREVDEDHKDDDDIDIFDLTLKQIRARLKAKKRKRSSAESTGCCSSVGSDNSSSKSEIDDCNMTESLHSFAAKIIKNKKMKKRLKRNSNLKSSHHALSIVKFEGVSNCYECPCHSDARYDAHVDVNVEVPERDLADCQAIVLSGMDSSYSWKEPLDSVIFPFNVEHGLGDQCDGGILETGYVDCQPISVDSMDDSCGWLVPVVPSGAPFDEQPCSSFGCDVEMVIPTVSSDELVESEVLDFQTRSVTVDGGAFQPLTSNYFSNEPQCCSGQSHFQTEEFDRDNDDVFPYQRTTCVNGLQNYSVNEMSYQHLEETGKASPPSANTSQYCASNEESDKDIEHVVPLGKADAEDLGLRVMILDKAGVVIDQLATKLSSSKFENLVVDSHERDEFGESVSPSKGPSLTVLDESEDDLLVSNNEKLQNDTSQFEITIKYSTECLADSSLPGGEVEDEKTCLETNFESCTGAVVEEQVEISFPNSSQNDSLSDDSSPDVETESLSSPSAVSVGRKIFCTHQQVQLIDGEDCCIVEQQQQPPERLLSTRKTISSTSQEKLRKAMNSNELDDEQLYKYARKLCYGKRTSNTNARSDEINQQVKRVENTISPHQLMRKLKSGKPSCPPKDIPRVARAIRNSPRFSTGCTSVQSCSENAIMFTQNQMRDFESMTTKLAKELKSMKEIVESTLLYKVNPCTTPNYTHQQVSGAIEKATKAEETARRWISTMGRDCDRFCKLMKLVQKGNSTPAQAVQKEKRKISFADEAGGNLCHVKTFKSEVEFIADEAIVVD